MKPKIDLKTPWVKIGIEIHNKTAQIALETPRDVEKAVIPIYAIPKSKGHQSIKRKAEQFGTGVLLNIKSQYFILSSTHLFEAFEGYALKTGTGKGLTENLIGERFSTGNIDNPYGNILDATVFHIQSEMSEELKNLAISLDDLEFENTTELEKPMYLLAGFRIKKSNLQGNEVTSKQEAFPTVEVDSSTYSLFGIDSTPQLILAYEDDILVDGKWQKSPIPRGFSGGAVIKIEGTNIRYPKTRKTKQKLRAIINEHHREKNNNPGIVISTKINVHIGLIAKFLPEILE